MEVSVNGGTPIAGWFIREHPTIKWMIWGYPYFRKPPNMHCKMAMIFFGSHNDVNLNDTMKHIVRNMLQLRPLTVLNFIKWDAMTPATKVRHHLNEVFLTTYNCEGL